MNLNYDNLFNEYIVKKQNIEEVAQMFDVSKDTIKRKLKKFNIHKERSEIFKQSKSKYEKTMLEKYGTISPIKNNKIKEKIKATIRERYGVEYITQSEEMKEKTRKTNLEKYGKEYVLQNEDIKQKSRLTWLKRYGVDNPAKNEEIQNKITKTNLERYGIKNAGGAKSSIEKGIKTNIEKYGIDYTGRLRQFRIKAVKTSKLSRSKIDGKRFDSQYEKDFYDYCLKNGLKIEGTQIPIEYEYNSKKHITFIDFKVDGKLFECKGAHLLKGVFDNRLEVPIDKKLEIYEKNNVIIITDKRGIDEIKKKNNSLIVEDIKKFKK